MNVILNLRSDIHDVEKSSSLRLHPGGVTGHHQWPPWSDRAYHIHYARSTYRSLDRCLQQDWSKGYCGDRMIQVAIPVEGSQKATRMPFPMSCHRRFLSEQCSDLFGWIALLSMVILGLSCFSLIPILYLLMVQEAAKRDIGGGPFNCVSLFSSRRANRKQGKFVPLLPQIYSSKA